MDGSGQTVLLVEDDPALRKLVKSYLVNLGLSVIEAGDGQTAIHLLSEHTLDLVCLDLMLPEFSGYDVCEILRKSARNSAVPVLMISARALPEDRAAAMEVGASAYLTKPFSKADFSREVRALLAANPRGKPRGD